MAKNKLLNPFLGIRKQLGSPQHCKLMSQSCAHSHTVTTKTHTWPNVTNGMPQKSTETNSENQKPASNRMHIAGKPHRIVRWNVYEMVWLMRMSILAGRGGSRNSMNEM